MSIKEISSEMLPVDPLKGKKSAAAGKAGAMRKDKAELSEEAKSLFEADQSKRMDQIREKLEQGFYSTPEAMEKIVAGLWEDLQRTGQE